VQPVQKTAQTETCVNVEWPKAAHGPVAGCCAQCTSMHVCVPQKQGFVVYMSNISSEEVLCAVELDENCNTCVLKDLKVLPFPLIESSALRLRYDAAKSTFAARVQNTLLGVHHHMGLVCLLNYARKK
jgi:hypothetical protein